MLLYNAFLGIYFLGIRIVSIANPKARLWIKGRRNIFRRIQSSYRPGGSKKIWMHCASLGEFEQGRPLLKQLREMYPDVSIAITFFSPSGYETVKDDGYLDQVFYLPMDSAANAKRLIEILRPDLVLWVKYEYWYYYLREINKRNIPLLMVSGVYHPKQIFFKRFGGFYRKMLTGFTHFFVQNTSSKNELAKLISEEKITVSGDTRCDRVINIAENFIEIMPIKAFCGNQPTIVAGSTWEDDEAEWTHYVRNHPSIKFIIAPHEIDQKNLHDVQKEFSGSVFYSEWLQEYESNGNEQPKTNCLIIDNIGMLSRLYKYATITYVGGGFGYNGLHNILEAAVYGKPVIFGPEYHKNFEAEELIDCSGGISIENALELEKVVNNLLANPQESATRGKAAKDYVYKNAGASGKIAEYIQANRLLTS